MHVACDSRDTGDVVWELATLCLIAGGADGAGASAARGARGGHGGTPTRRARGGIVGDAVAVVGERPRLERCRIQSEKIGCITRDGHFGASIDRLSCAAPA